MDAFPTRQDYIAKHKPHHTSRFLSVRELEQSKFAVKDRFTGEIAACESGFVSSDTGAARLRHELTWRTDSSTTAFYVTKRNLTEKGQARRHQREEIGHAHGDKGEERQHLMRARRTCAV